MILEQTQSRVIPSPRSTPHGVQRPHRVFIMYGSLNCVGASPIDSAHIRGLPVVILAYSDNSQNILKRPMIIYPSLLSVQITSSASLWWQNSNGKSNGNSHGNSNGKSHANFHGNSGWKSHGNSSVNSHSNSLLRQTETALYRTGALFRSAGIWAG